MPRQRLDRDPSMEVMPDYNNEAMRTLLQDRLKDRETMEQLIQGLKDDWETCHQERMAQWAEQQGEENAEAEEAQRLREEEERRRLEDERSWAAPKKPKLKGLSTNKLVVTVSMPRPSSYALNKLKQFDYVELYYFTPEGCKDASCADRTTSNNALAPACIDDQVVFQPVAAHKPSSKVVMDADLTWNEVSVAKTSLLKCMQDAGWPEEHITALSTFFYEQQSSDKTV
ncbi:hypothetical protein FA15DRAFT_710558 [Coprinopsis marcescibilis]|uniref:Uncharacterized protein n=1 Tax=Coprinopsis marcescibilis TaxID=230819 RepID=A0A5C3KDF5_COPMA|nr:hypothetical protein FA15DRAFT_710558 [Coprinopsis marcescibilis]